MRPFKLLLFEGSAIRAGLETLRREVSDAAKGVAEPLTEGHDGNSASATGDTAHGGPIASQSEDEMRAKKQKPTLIKHLSLLVDFMDQKMADIVSLQQQTEGTQLCQSFCSKTCTTCFETGQLVITSRQSVTGEAERTRRAYRVLHVTGGRSVLNIKGKPTGDNRTAAELFDWSPEGSGQTGQKQVGLHISYSPLILDCCYIDYDGEYYGPKALRFVILEYTGTRAIKTLEIYPAQYDDGFASTRASLLERGTAFAECAGMQECKHRRYNGRTLKDESHKFDQEEVSHDPSAWQRRNSLIARQVRSECVLDQASILGDGRLEFGDGTACETPACGIMESTQISSAKIQRPDIPALT